MVHIYLDDFADVAKKPEPQAKKPVQVSQEIPVKADEKTQEVMQQQVQQQQSLASQRAYLASHFATPAKPVVKKPVLQVVDDIEPMLQEMQQPVQDHVLRGQQAQMMQRQFN